MATKLRVATVQEHFCSPLWQLAESDWGRANIELVFNNSGSGQMISNLSNDGDGRKIDAAVALTEALIAGIAKGRRDYKLVGSYVRSSLNWAVITGTDPKATKYQNIDDLKGETIGISRIGSGSQTMAYYMAMQQGWGADIKFKVNDTFENLRKGVNQEPGLETAAFMWEWVTTLPYVHSGQVRYIGNVPTPWPSWSIAASTSILVPGSEDQQLLDTFLSKLQESIATFLHPDSISQQKPQQFVQQRFEYKPEDVETWFNSVRYVRDPRPDSKNDTAVALVPTGQQTCTETVSRETITTTLSILAKAGAIQTPHGGFDLADFAREQSLVD
ncbi:hypothetical protein K437DRAFT_245687 [Tilletiaria anomala UBC 951]|uniref:Ca3427-like PBP 2 domain-containing protein n=1 Tax=Tilletiaria anomala (strain ATCC 24038 / CBS 436.72 / UBC 951) TaxID=1037660 RepID=A0A066W384_TILAU|nr:uncharacterized protein K437DRAFT_245687 [Tilletiaria anomala UBC 951]KDN48191.1 hypothetical protein K437DRAFT_245687 [Tilletiaria anomala UBC 951]